MYETETKVLEVNTDDIRAKLIPLGAVEILNTKFDVDWFRPAGVKEGEDKWYLRIRTDNDGKSEVTWKGKSDVLGSSRTHKEINFGIADAGKLADLFIQIGLEKYAHQEKLRTSWTFKDWRFDLDRYPNMPAYLEIEGKDEAHIQEAIAMLNLGIHETSSEGERVLIQKKYGQNWYDMRF